MSTKDWFTLLFVSGVAIMVACDAMRLFLLNAFARSSGKPTRLRILWWNHFAERKLQRSLPEGSLRSRIRALEIISQIVRIPLIIVAFIQIVLNWRHSL